MIQLWNYQDRNILYMFDSAIENNLQPQINANSKTNDPSFRIAMHNM